MKSYFFTPVASTASKDSIFKKFDSFGAPAINDFGTLTWKGFLKKNDGSGIFARQNGQGISTIANTTQGFTEFGYSTINNSGTTAFYAKNNTQSGIYLGTGKFTTTVAQTGQTFGKDLKFSIFRPDPSISNSGNVAFLAGLTGDNSRVSGVFVGNGKSITTIVDSKGCFADLLGTSFEGDIAPSINNRGDVVFWGMLDETLPTGSPEYTKITSLIPPDQQPDPPEDVKPGNVRGIFVADTQGNIKTVVDNKGEYLSFAGAPDINNDGTIAYVFRGDEGTSATALRGINLYEKGRTTTVVDNKGAYSRFGAPDINDWGDIAFRAQLDASPSKDPVLGIYTGANPETDKVIETGDKIDGQTITNLVFFNKGLNNKGQIAFLAEFKNGSQGMYRADPYGAGDDYKIRSLGDEHAAFPTISNDKAIKDCLTPKTSWL